MNEVKHKLKQLHCDLKALACIFISITLTCFHCWVTLASYIYHSKAYYRPSVCFCLISLFHFSRQLVGISSGSVVSYSVSSMVALKAWRGAWLSEGSITNLFCPFSFSCNVKTQWDTSRLHKCKNINRQWWQTVFYKLLYNILLVENCCSPANLAGSCSSCSQPSLCILPFLSGFSPDSAAIFTGWTPVWPCSRVVPAL